MDDFLRISDVPDLDVFSTPSELDSLTFDVRDLRDEPGIEYPALLLSHVLFVDSLKILKQVKRESFREVAVWAELPNDEGFAQLGTLQLDSDVLLLLRHLHIGAVLYYSAEDIEVLDLSNPDVLEKFI